MIEIVIYKTSDGDILRSVICPEDMVDVQIGEGEAFIEHDRVDDTMYKVDLNTLEIIPVE